ncbi:MAG: type II toxin-antitoxin system VapC family toxin [Rhizobiaceae bacterium]|nr:type II toxin-antitoxin system VapC family toxin [Rhizobiaceae bacterium]
MTGFLLDTSVLSTFAPERDPVPVRVADFVEAHGESLYLPSMAVAEISKGVAKLKRHGAIRKAAALDLWLDEIETRFTERILSFDTASARAAGMIDDAATAPGRNPGLADVVIAATARIHGLTVVTRNTRHFEALDVPCLDPFESA